MATATEIFAIGGEQVTVGLTIDLPTGETPIAGDFAGLIPAGSTARIVGDVNLTGDLVVEGLLTGIDTFHVQGNGFSIFFQNGGRADLHGKIKGRWGEWGTDLRSADITGWLVGDRLAIAPTGVGKYTAVEGSWTGAWASMTRPSVSPDVPLINGSVYRPEVANVSQTIVFENLARGFHFHDSAGVQMLSDVKFLNCGTTKTLGHYPVHFHQLYDNSRGSLIERVVVEGGKNHAFVPHGSHGITMKDCVAYKTVSDAFWWDEPEQWINNGTPCPNCDPGPPGTFCMKCRSGNMTTGQWHHVANNSNDTLWDHCLVLDLNSTEPFHPAPLSGFLLGAGSGNKCINCVAAAVRRGTGPSGFQWPSSANRNDGDNEWDFHDCLSHNIDPGRALFVWQNTPDDHLIRDFIGYRIGGTGINHGAYSNHYHYQNVLIDGAIGPALTLHPVSTPAGQPMIFEDFNTNGTLKVVGHQIRGDDTPTYFRRCVFTQVIVEDSGNFQNPSNLIFEDCPMQPANFVFVAVVPSSVFELWEGGVLQHRWTNGAWT